MKRVLHTGMSGTGKSAAITEPTARGYKAIDTASEDADVLFISGGAANQGKFYTQFDQIVLLTAPTELMTERLATRANNPYGKDPDQLARVLALKETVEPALRRIADIEIDTSVPLAQVVDKIVSVAVAAGPGR